MLEYIRDVVNPDAVFWTGDSIAHNFFDHTSDKIVNDLKNVSSLINQYLGNS